jgi:hypothetical protein
MTNKTALPLPPPDTHPPTSLLPLDMRFIPKEGPPTYAVNYFLSCYTGGVYLEYVPAFYRSDHCSPSLRASVEAVALACLANKMGSRDLLALAREKYGMALQGTNAALQSVPTATTDETLVSVMLLAFFTAVLSGPQEAQDTWSRHINGALTLVLLRRPEQFHSEIGQAMFHHVISCVQIDCLQRCTRLPTQLKDLYPISLLDGAEFQLRFWALVDRVAVLRTATRVNSMRAMDILETLRQSESLDEEVLYLMQIMPTTHRYEVIPNNGDYAGDGIPNQFPYHSYATSRIAQAWNTLRMLRLSINNTRFSHAALYLESQIEIPMETQLELKTHMLHARHTAIVMSAEICASVPEFLRPNNQQQQRPGMDPDNNGNKHSAAWAHSLFWPVSAAGASPHTSEDLRRYIDRQRCSLEITSGLGQARRLHAATPSEFDNAGVAQDWQVNPSLTHQLLKFSGSNC